MDACIAAPLVLCSGNGEMLSAQLLPKMAEMALSITCASSISTHVELGHETHVGLVSNRVRGHLCGLHDADDVERLQRAIEANLRCNIGAAAKVMLDNCGVFKARAEVLISVHAAHGLAVHGC